MKRCMNCFMPDTKPGLVIDTEGYCQACRHYQMRKNVDYGKRFHQLKTICNRYRRNDGYYDCMITVSGGKDSHFQVYVFKKLLKMNPLLVTVSDPFTKTKAGRHNMKNLCDVFNCDLMTLSLSPNLVRRMVRIAFEEFGSPTWPIDRAIYCYPIRIGINMKIPFIIYGDNVSWEYGGVLQEETYSALEQIRNDVAKKVSFDLWRRHGITDQEMNMFQYPKASEIKKAQLNPVYLSYFIPWDGYLNYKIAKKYGFKDLKGEWRRSGYIEDYDQIDSIAYLMNPWLKYPKFGFARATDVVGYWIRSSKINREEGVRLIKKHDHLLDPRILSDFLAFTGYSKKEFWKIVDKYWNRKIFRKVEGEWKLRPELEPKL